MSKGSIEGSMNRSVDRDVGRRMNDRNDRRMIDKLGVVYSTVHTLGAVGDFRK